MKLEDKIIMLRKQNGWSQEELAFQLDVSRQAVSKWEGGQTLPEMDKIVKLSELFEVTTDFLLKEELVENETKEEKEDLKTKYLNKNEARSFLNASKKSIFKLSFGVFLSITSPVLLILLKGLFEINGFINENLSIAIGLVSLFIFVAIAVYLFIFSGFDVREYSYLYNHKLMFDIDLRKELKKEQNNLQKTRFTRNALSITTYILSIIPLIVLALLGLEQGYLIISFAFLLILVALATSNIIFAESHHGTYTKLLEEEGYSVKSKKAYIKIQKLDIILWIVVAGIYFVVSFLTGKWTLTWLIFVVGGIIYTILYFMIHDKE